MNEANMLMTPIIRSVTANAHDLFSELEIKEACGKTLSVSGLKDVVFSNVKDCLPRLRTMVEIINPTTANNTIRIIISVMAQIVYAIMIIVAIKRMKLTKAAHFTWVGIGLFGADTGSVALSNKSQSALKNKKPPKLKFINFCN